MEALQLQPVRTEQIEEVVALPPSSPFIEANTVQLTLDEIRSKHIIPTYRNNERLISVAEFIDTCNTVVQKLYPNEMILEPNIRLSHLIQGRIPEAKYKNVSELEERETTLFYERCAFYIEVPSIQTDIAGNTLSLMVGGTKSYNLDNVNGKENSAEHFSFFIGYINKICCNGCIWGDGYSKMVGVRTLNELHALIHALFEQYNASHHLFHLRRLSELHITEKQFAQLIGKAKMYQYLPNEMKNSISPLLLGDAQLNAVVKDYYRDTSFCRSENGGISLWNLYNLITGATKSSYIDSFLDRNVNAYHFVENVRWAIENQSHNWFLN